MKQLVLLLLLLMNVFTCFSQQRKVPVFHHVIYRDSIGNKVEKEQAYTVEVFSDKFCKRTGSHIKVRVKDSLVLLQGTYENGERAGVWTKYYENGNKKILRKYERTDGGNRVIHKEEYYLNGKRKAIWKPVNDTLLGLLYAFSPDGEPLVEEGNGYMKNYTDTGGVLNFEGPYRNGVKDGDFTYFDDGESYHYQFKEGKLVKKSANQTFLKHPRYPGGESKLRLEVQRNFYIPKSFSRQMKKLNSCAKVVVKFEVLADGSIGEIKPLTTYGMGLEQEAVEAIEDLRKKFKPGLLHGKPKKVWYTLPIVIQMR